MLIARYVTMAAGLGFSATPFAAAGPGPPALEQGYHHMYNLEFDEAHRVFNAWEQLHPDDPLAPASNAAAYLFAELDRLHILETELFVNDGTFSGMQRPAADPRVKLAFEREVARAGELADAALARSSQATHALFAKVLVAGLRSDYAGLIEKRYLASVAAMKTGRALAEKLLAIDPSYYDAHLAIGVENYMLSLRPAPVRWLLSLGGARTDRQQGLAKLRLAAEKGHYLAPFAKLLLAVAALRDKDAERARRLLDGLAREFPHNRLYARELARLR